MRMDAEYGWKNLPGDTAAPGRCWKKVFEAGWSFPYFKVMGVLPTLHCPAPGWELFLLKK